MFITVNNPLKLKKNYGGSRKCRVLQVSESFNSDTQTHTQPFNGPFSGTTQVSRDQKGKTNLDFTEAREWLPVASAGPYAIMHLAPDR